MGITAALAGELDAVGDWGVLTTDVDLTITSWNRWLEQRVGGSAEVFVGRPLLEVFPDLVTRKFDNYYRQALSGQTVLLSQRLHRYLLPLPANVAETRFGFMQQTARIIPLVDAGTVQGTVTVIEDVTERVAYETELRERVEALRNADRHKDEFLAMLAHELRNPLAPIANAVNLLRMVQCNEPVVENARDLIERQVSQLARLVDDLLDVSRITRGKLQLQKMPLDLRAVLEQAIETSRPLIESRRHRLAVTLPSYPVRVEGDFVRLAQVVSNLLNNAAKYTDEGGDIHVTVDKEEGGDGAPGQAVVRVADSGRGIEPAALSSLFDLFYQGDRNLDRSDGGLGIGLSVVKRLTEMHGGTVEVHSGGAGKGSAFVIRLPLCLGGAPSGLGASVRPGPAARPARILVVDDNRDSAESMAQLLQMLGHEILTAYDGRQAVEVALRERPAVILLDIGLPGLNGYQVCRMLREAGLTHSLLIAMTGYGQEEDRRLSSEAHFDAHLVKPVDFGELRQLLADLPPGNGAEHSTEAGCRPS